MSRKISTIMKQLIVPIICVSFAISLTSTAWADNSDRQFSEDGAEQAIALLKKTVTLAKKNSKMVSTTTGERYGVNQATMVVDEDGSQIMLQYMLVPCKAQLLYEETSGGGTLVHRIMVINTHQGATNHMSEKPK
jgi:uncharacterized protein YpmB